MTIIETTFVTNYRTILSISDYSVLFTCVGRRVEFIEQMQQTMQNRVKVIASDVHDHAPALKFANVGLTLPLITEPDFPGRLLDLCQAHQVSHVFPLIDTELPIYSTIKKEMALFGVNMVVSDRNTIDLTRDKYSFATFLREKQIQTPEVIEDINQVESLNSYCVRPRFGSRSVGMQKIKGHEVEKWLKRRDLIITKWIDGTENSIDILVDENKAKIIVPRERNLIRDGESVIGTTRNQTEIIELTHQLVGLIPGLYGPLCLQLIKNENGLFITELNARFGGGVTLSNAAGAGFSEWIVSQVTKTPFTAPSWVDGKKMYRYLKGWYV